MAAAFGSSPPTSTTDRRYHATNVSSRAQEHDSRGPKGAAGIYKVDKHRPVAVERPDHNSRNGVDTTNNFRKPSTTANGAKPMNGNAVFPNRPANGHSQQKPNNDYMRKPDASLASDLPTTKPNGFETKLGAEGKECGIVKGKGEAIAKIPHQ